MNVAEVKRLAEQVRAEVGKAIVGQRDTIDLLLTALFARGHVLLEGPPGVAKTYLAQCFARTLGLDFGRIQFTPDLMPADIIGSNVFNFQTSTFSLTEGPLFCELLLADEINRTPPKTQAALLEAMEERQVTLDGERLALGRDFFVIATQNPVEYEGTYPLPEAQTDRFMMKIRVGYPEAADELEILRRSSAGADSHDLAAAGVTPVLSHAELTGLREQGRRLEVAPPLLDYVARLVRGSRQLTRVRLGASPRAGVALLAASRARAVLRGAEWLSPDDVKASAPPVLRHRLVLRPDAELEGASAEELVAELLDTVPVPR